MNEFIFNTFTWTIIGFIVAYIADLTSLNRRKGGTVATLIFGLVGAFLGGILSNIFLGNPIIGISLPGVILACIALVFLTILHTILLRRKKTPYDDYPFVKW